MLKSNFSDGLSSKTQTAQTDEASCEVPCRNICRVIQPTSELGSGPEFREEVA